MSESSGYKTQLSFTTVSSGDTVTAGMHIGSAKYATLHMPPLNACSMFVLAAPTHTGSFYRVQNAAGNADQAYLCGSGSVVYSLPERFVALDHVKLEFSAAQTDTRTIALILGW